MHRPLRLSISNILYTFLCAFSLFQTACTSSSSSTVPEKVLSAEEQTKVAEYKAEVVLGRDMAGRLLQYYGTYGDPALIQYVNQVGQYVASYSDFPERRYMFAILDTDAVNAFACPGGYILITLGTLKQARSEAELAMILGHEIAHVGHQHMFKTLQTMGQKELEKAENEAQKRGGSKENYINLLRARPKSEESEAAALVTRYLVQSAGVGMSLLQAAKAGMSVLLEKGLDKELEYEADHFGVNYAVKAGYHPQALQQFLKRLSLNKKKKKGSIQTKVLEKTHPSLAKRQQRISTQLTTMQADQIVGADGRDRFLPYLKKLMNKNK